MQFWQCLQEEHNWNVYTCIANPIIQNVSSITIVIERHNVIQRVQMKFYKLQLQYILSEFSSKQTEIEGKWKKKHLFMQIRVSDKLHIQSVVTNKFDKL